MEKVTQEKSHVEVGLPALLATFFPADSGVFKSLKGLSHEMYLSFDDIFG
jgi:hypothetical protein